MLSISLNKCISIHALRVEGDGEPGYQPIVQTFISIHALRVEGDGRCLPLLQRLQISIHALRVEGDPVTVNQRHGIIISIHALRVEGDANYYEYSPEELISIHALRVEGDIGAIIMDMPALQFLSTPSGWRATHAFFARRRFCFDFYPRPPGGGRHAVHRPRDPVDTISIHALRVEGDVKTPLMKSSTPYFYPRPPGGGRPPIPKTKGGTPNFYPRPPGGGRPAVEITPRWRALYFYPRPPGGGRRPAPP